MSLFQEDIRARFDSFDLTVFIMDEVTAPQKRPRLMQSQFIIPASIREQPQPLKMLK